MIRCINYECGRVLDKNGQILIKYSPVISGEQKARIDNYKLESRFQEKTALIFIKFEGIIKFFRFTLCQQIILLVDVGVVDEIRWKKRSSIIQFELDHLSAEVGEIANEN